jgi:hypothetical protein
MVLKRGGYIEETGKLVHAWKTNAGGEYILLSRNYPR